MTSTARTFLLSPASTAGRRAAILFRDAADFDLARRVRSTGAPLGEVFSFLSGLYFRGKLAYARAFAPPDRIFIITSSRGLMSPEAMVTIDDLRELASTPIDLTEPRYRVPFERDVSRLGDRSPIVLLGSIASGKYVDILLDAVGDRLLFPGEFVGRGDMSRGGLLLRQVDAGVELAYVPVRGARRHGSRPPRLVPRPAARST